MGIRIGALILAFALVAIPSAAGAETIVTRIVQFDTHSAVRITHFTIGRHREFEQSREQSSNLQVICLAFENTGAPVVKRVAFHFVFYDALNNHAGETDLIRTGTYAQDAHISAGVDRVTGRIDDADCISLPYHEQGIALIVAYVKALTFADGSTWSTSGPAIPEHLDPAAATPAASP